MAGCLGRLSERRRAAAERLQSGGLTCAPTRAARCQVERWGGDPNQYVADEEDDFSTVRYACIVSARMYRLHSSLAFIACMYRGLAELSGVASQRPPCHPLCPVPCRAAGEMLLDELFEGFGGEVAAPLAAAVGARLQEAAAARAAGKEDWWKLREAALYGVGTVSDRLLELGAGGGGAGGLDVPGLMASVLQVGVVWGGESP